MQGEILAYLVNRARCVAIARGSPLLLSCFPAQSLKAMELRHLADWQKSNQQLRKYQISQCEKERRG
jgi:hypothetical protein